MHLLSWRRLLELSTRDLTGFIGDRVHLRFTCAGLLAGPRLYWRRFGALFIKRAACARRDRLAVVTQARSCFVTFRLSALGKFDVSHTVTVTYCHTVSPFEAVQTRHTMHVSNRHRLM